MAQTPFVHATAQTVPKRHNMLIGVSQRPANDSLFLVGIRVCVGFAFRVFVLVSTALAVTFFRDLFSSALGLDIRCCWSTA